jgi:hypothetical protein
LAKLLEDEAPLLETEPPSSIVKTSLFPWVVLIFLGSDSHLISQAVIKNKLWHSCCAGREDGRWMRALMTL